MTKTLPLSIRDTPPSDGCTRLTGTRTDGLPDGVHTGGAWSKNGEVWKPLDGRPYVNAECHLPTQEDEILTLLAGEPMFPQNWRVEWANGRRFLVRKEAYILGKDFEYTDLSLAHIYTLEQAIRSLNGAGWELGDDISLAIDKDSYELFILDLSNANKISHPYHRPDDEWRVESVIRKAGYERLVKFRRAARKVALPANSIIKPEDWPGDEYEFVYASRNRPLSTIWAQELKQYHFVEGDKRKDGVFTWLLAPEPLPANLCHRFELTWGWSPMHRGSVPGQEQTR